VVVVRGRRERGMGNQRQGEEKGKTRRSGFNQQGSRKGKSKAYLSVVSTQVEGMVENRDEGRDQRRRLEPQKT